MHISRDIAGLGTVSTDKTYFDGTVAQFRGIPYGAVTRRFQRPTIVDEWPTKALDACQFGPVSPTPALAATLNLVGATLEAEDPIPPADEFLCLNLNITAPTNNDAAKKLPVLVFIHGGANCMGAGSTAGYKGAPLVHMSLGMGQPIVVVTMNFRLGAFGFLASADLEEDNRAAGDRGVGNYGIHDQIVALQWVKRYIGAFGGDPGQVTVVGQSAGGSEYLGFLISADPVLTLRYLLTWRAGDIHIQMLSRWASREQLFSQAVIMSGNAVLTTRSLEHQEGIYQKFLAHLQIPSDIAASDKVQRLRDVPVNELLNAYIATGSPLPNWQATVDGFLLDDLPRSSTIGDQQYDTYVRRIIIGDCEKEGIIWAPRIAKLGWTPDKIRALLSSCFPAEVVDRMTSSYNLSDFSPEQAVAILEPFCNDAEFGRDIHAIAKSFSAGAGKALYYHMRYGNPFPGPFQNLAHHAVDLLFLFQTYNHLLPDKLAEAAQQMGRHWINFLNGGDPWPAYSEGESSMCYGPEEVALLGRKEDDMGRYERWENLGGTDEWPRCSMIIRGEVASLV
ncbi:hypothetical protein A1O7_06165 [Cladophialophora yegresii CBS 114405]|uniref:Carboxylic ester hydrolase n=1 Tax=Cladophialophora yegresii CBS 114405 TaxID=1182544 RepID=W9W175_9EURO|nr:uncharacterized protein A1O7_06165 [Cladophialophora yegresii CBS 114405]EXJ58735.1 hypothetical protein A1O7_06165 [Cladophialophora yegresii CBS 114405]